MSKKTWADFTTTVASAVRVQAQKIEHESKVRQGVNEGVKLAFKEVFEQLQKPGDKFIIPGVGTFVVQRRKAKRNFNPNTGNVDMLPERMKIVFHASSPMIGNVVRAVSSFKDIEAA